MRNEKILVVDDEAGIRESISGHLEGAGYLCRGAPDGEAALRGLRRRFDLLISDINMPGLAGRTQPS